MNERQTTNRQGQSTYDAQEKFPSGAQQMGNQERSTGGSQGTQGYTTQSRTGQQAGMQGSAGTGAEDRMYNLVSVLYHALEGGATYGKYVQDAEQAGDDDLAQFFRQTQQEERQRAERAQQLLASRLGQRR